MYDRCVTTGCKGREGAFGAGWFGGRRLCSSVSRVRARSGGRVPLTEQVLSIGWHARRATGALIKKLSRLCLRHTKLLFANSGSAVRPGPRSHKLLLTASVGRRLGTSIGFDLRCMSTLAAPLGWLMMIFPPCIVEIQKSRHCWKKKKKKASLTQRVRRKERGRERELKKPSRPKQRTRNAWSEGVSARRKAEVPADGGITAPINRGEHSKPYSWCPELLQAVSLQVVLFMSISSIMK